MTMVKAHNEITEKPPSGINSPPITEIMSRKIILGVSIFMALVFRVIMPRLFSFSKNQQNKVMSWHKIVLV